MVDSPLELEARRHAAETGVGTPSYRAYVLVLLLLLHIFSFVDRTLMGILAPAIKRDLNVSDGTLGLMNGLAFALLYVGASIPISFMADRFNRARILAGSLALWSLCTSLCGLAGTSGQLFAARMAVGVGEAGGTAPSHAIIADYFPRAQRARALGIYSFGVPLGSTIGMLLGAYISTAFNWRTTFLFIGVLGLPLAALVLMTVKEPRLAQKTDSWHHIGIVAAARSIGTRGAFWFVSLGGGVAAMMGYGLVFWMPSFLSRSHGMPLTTVALVYGGTTALGGVLGNIIGGWSGDRLVRKMGPAGYCLVPAVGFLISAPFVIIALLADSRWVIFSCLLVPALAGGSAQPTIISAVQHLATVRTRAVASAMMMVVNTLIGLALGTALMGYVSDQFAARYGSESLRYAILSCTGLYVLASALLLLAWRAIRSERPIAASTAELGWSPAKA